MQCRFYRTLLTEHRWVAASSLSALRAALVQVPPGRYAVECIVTDGRLPVESTMGDVIVHEDQSIEFLFEPAPPA